MLSGTVPLPVSEMVNVSLSVMVVSTLLAAPMPTLALVVRRGRRKLGVSATVKVSSPSIRPSLKVGRLKLKLPLKAELKVSVVDAVKADAGLGIGRGLNRGDVLLAEIVALGAA